MSGSAYRQLLLGQDSQVHRDFPVLHEMKNVQRLVGISCELIEI